MDYVLGRYEVAKAKALVNDLGDAAELVYKEGIGAKTTVFVTIPNNVESIVISGPTITVNLYSKGSSRQIYRNFGFNVSGKITPEAGGLYVKVESKEDYVQIGNSPDTTPPNVTSMSPEGYINSNITTLNAVTDENSVCRYCKSTVCNEETPYNSMPNTMSGLKKVHSASLGPLGEGSHIYYIRCNDTYGNIMNYSALVQFEVDLSPPSSVINLQNQSRGLSWIYWNWTNPNDPDHNHSKVYINDIFYSNVYAPNNSFNATGLLNNTNYTIKVFSVDHAGNINTTDYGINTTSTAYPLTITLNVTATTGETCQAGCSPDDLNDQDGGWESILDKGDVLPMSMSDILGSGRVVDVKVYSDYGNTGGGLSTDAYEIYISNSQNEDAGTIYCRMYPQILPDTNFTNRLFDCEDWLVDKKISTVSEVNGMYVHIDNEDDGEPATFHVDFVKAVITYYT
ncbi:MAG: hypothetical protein D6797_07245 [Bdellovibrio sp.]|nr:MAG: hypothetical protein D6797_07245 [Bdellovibrio sp.]